MLPLKTRYTAAILAALAFGAIAAAGIGFSGTHVAERPVQSDAAPIPADRGDRPMDKSGLLRWIK